MKSDRPQTLSEALGLKRWSVVCHPDDRSKLGKLSKDFKEMADTMRRFGLKIPKGKLPIVVSEIIPIGRALIVGPAISNDELDGRWETLKELGFAQ
jgi:hypothetical protein